MVKESGIVPGPDPEPSHGRVMRLTRIRESCVLQGPTLNGAEGWSDSDEPGSAMPRQPVLGDTPVTPFVLKVTTQAARLRHTAACSYPHICRYLKIALRKRCLPWLPFCCRMNELPAIPRAHARRRGEIDLAGVPLVHDEVRRRHGCFEKRSVIAR
jgi:hypothetical protein